MIAKLLKWPLLEKKGNKYSLLCKIQGPSIILGLSARKEYVTLIYLFSAPLLEDVLSYVKNEQWYVVLKGTSKENKTKVTSLQTHIYLCKFVVFPDPTVTQERQFFKLSLRMKTNAKCY